MEIVLEKSQVVDLRLDLHKQGISIGEGTVRQKELETERAVS